MRGLNIVYCTRYTTRKKEERAYLGDLGVFVKEHTNSLKDDKVQYEAVKCECHQSSESCLMGGLPTVVHCYGLPKDVKGFE